MYNPDAGERTIASFLDQQASRSNPDVFSLTPDSLPQILSTAPLSDMWLITIECLKRAAEIKRSTTIVGAHIDEFILLMREVMMEALLAPPSVPMASMAPPPPKPIHVRRFDLSTVLTEINRAPLVNLWIAANICIKVVVHRRGPLALDECDAQLEGYAMMLLSCHMPLP
jgi:hypothetical protein